MRRAGLLPAIAVAVSVLLPATGRAHEAAPRPAPDFTLPSLQGSVSLDSLRGHPVLVDFWASWCGPCRKSFPWMNDLVKRYGPKGLEVVAIDLDKDRGLANAFLRELPPSFTIAFDPKGRTAEAYRVAAMPSTFLVGPSGNLIATHAGFDEKHAAELESRIQEALAK